MQYFLYLLAQCCMDGLQIDLFKISIVSPVSETIKRQIEIFCVYFILFYFKSTIIVL